MYLIRLRRSDIVSLSGDVSARYRGMSNDGKESRRWSMLWNHQSVLLTKPKWIEVSRTTRTSRWINRTSSWATSGSTWNPATSPRPLVSARLDEVLRSASGTRTCSSRLRWARVDYSPRVARICCRSRAIVHGPVHCAIRWWRATACSTLRINLDRCIMRRWRNDFKRPVPATCPQSARSCNSARRPIIGNSTAARRAG